MRIGDWSSDVCSSDLDRGRGAAGAGAADDPGRLGVAFVLQLADDRFGDVVVAAPVGGALGQAELVEQAGALRGDFPRARSEEHTSELQSLMRNSYAVFCLKEKIKLVGLQYSQFLLRPIRTNTMRYKVYQAIVLSVSYNFIT